MTEEPAKPTTGLLSGRFWTLFVFVLLPLGTCSVALDVHKIAWYAVFPYSYYMEIKTDLTVDGEAVQLSGVAECHWDQRTGAILGLPNYTGFRKRGGILAKRLPSGEAVVTLVDVPCRARGNPSRFGGARKGFWNTVRPLDAPVERLSIQTLLLDDADEPTRIELSYSKEYFGDPRARLRYLGGTYLPKRWAQRTDPRDEVPWLRVERGSPKFWVGFYANVTPLDVWETEPAVVAALKPFKKVTKLYGEHLLPSSKGFYLTDGRMHTLHLKDGYWDYQPDELVPDGLAVLYPHTDPVTGESIPRDRSDNIFSAESRLSVNGEITSVGPPIYVGAVYEPMSRTILSIHRTGVSLSSDEVRSRLPFKF